ncbi:MAG: hypothetical protein MR627_01400 [Prevotella sp.]|nr:hypothetical protein [Prevotella sp.]MDD6393899.1 hypothetical protein [Prevotella sp.]
MENFEYYIIAIAVIIAGVFIIKKITGCMIRLVITLIVLGLLAYVGYKTGMIDLIITTNGKTV